MSDKPNEPLPKPARLLDLAKQREDADEATRAKKSREFAAAIDVVKNTWPQQLELIAYQAKEVRARYLALVKEGFSAAEALDLCWRRM